MPTLCYSYLEENGYYRTLDDALVNTLPIAGQPERLPIQIAEVHELTIEELTAHVRHSLNLDKWGLENLEEAVQDGDYCREAAWFARPDGGASFFDPAATLIAHGLLATGDTPWHAINPRPAIAVWDGHAWSIEEPA